ncbi:diguanylate cyclase [Psychromonas sp. GE-S-Ul-11]|uniref:diguanylate cyclase n=1 Tax=unclassified Psychromonas TaxID=2614957 RepID=UPI00390C5D6B
MPISLTSKIAILFTVSLTLITSIILFVFTIEVYNTNKNLFIQRGDIAVQELIYKTERLLQLGLLPNEFFGYEALCQKLVDNTEGLIYAALIDENGKVLFESTPLNNQQTTISKPNHFISQDNQYLIKKSLPPVTQQQHYIIATIDQHLLESKLTEFLIKMLMYASLIIFTGVILMIHFLRNNLGKPINSLINHIRNIDLDSQQGTHWDLLRRRDELSTVAITFNAMMSRLSNSQNSLADSNLKLQKLTNELEERVESRTKSLNKANKRLYSLARTDPLTGFHNRTKLEELLSTRFENAKKRGHHFAVLMADLDRFKYINDNFGHAAGDTALKTIGARILTSLRQRDSAYRVGGDEFIFIIEDHTNTNSLVKVAEKIKVAVEKPIHHEGQILSLGVSIGIAFLSKEVDCDAEGLLSFADKAMYQAKTKGLDYVISEY